MCYSVFSFQFSVFSNNKLNPNGPIALKEKSYTRTDAKSILGRALVLGLRVMNSSFLTVVFLQPFTLFFSHFSSFFLRVIYYSFTPFPPSTCGSGIGSLFFLFPLPLLEPSILSCKATYSLFRHHLHINAARELAGQHLMRG